MKFYQCENCKKVILSKEELKLEGWKELIPCSTDAAVEKHVPVVEKKCGRLRVSVGSVMHPATEAHYIEWVAVETKDGYQVKYFAPTDTPEVAFALKAGDEVVGVYAYCNLHGLWKA
ncbi:MAG: desulfoferrodoxin Dfx [Clostridia bacterium]|jgi:superoxide reductase|nr:desulfoferrodoxin Dfx [Clostridia bacterium]